MIHLSITPKRLLGLTMLCLCFIGNAQAQSADNNDKNLLFAQGIQFKAIAVGVTAKYATEAAMQCGKIYSDKKSVKIKTIAEIKNTNTEETILFHHPKKSED